MTCCTLLFGKFSQVIMHLLDHRVPIKETKPRGNTKPRVIKFENGNNEKISTKK